eukprot:IDg609t1
MLDSCQQFHLLGLCISNKETEELFAEFFQCNKTAMSRLNVDLNPDCTMSDNCPAIQKEFRSVFPDALIGNCFFHALKHNK